jgi:signal transduction histidine kinase
MTTPSSKLSVASAIGSIRSLRKRYDENPFFRSTVHVIALQAFLALLTVGILLAATAFDELDASIALTIALAVAVAVATSRYALAPTRGALAAQKRFIGNLAHELRTPLAIIRTSTEVALMDPKDQELTERTLAGTMEELDRVSGIINNLLSFQGLMSAGKLTFAPVDLAAVAKECAERHQELARTRGITLSVSAEGSALINGNAIAIGQVFTNLIKNALTYTPEHDNRRVDVQVSREHGTIQASVADTGIGIAQKDLFYIFEPFYRGDTSRQRGVGSGTSGLGLAIVNDIVRAHGGTIVIRSALNRGTTIELSFPALPDTPIPGNAPEDAELHEARIVQSA